MIPADQVHLYRPPSPDGSDRGSYPLDTHVNDTRSVQLDGAISAVQFNRYADPVRPNELMHEAHVVYRREAGPRWRLRPPSAQGQILVGPQVTDGRGEILPLVSQEVESYIREQRQHQQKQQQLTGAIAEAVTQLASQQQQLATEVAQLKQQQVSNPASASEPAAAAPGPSNIAPKLNNEDLPND
jgi:hypothetical protein